ncbi:amidase [Mesorhizobium soli]|uniref:amidase n=1 Tax=Pseudaminobacter soli (ex Li et al. 2025) TaxID=1295366 RepID=UPI002476F427|nr:amidase [Mesorhizobium soli]MDH6233406.1 amidase [Mesorhizobium soli]
MGPMRDSLNAFLDYPQVAVSNAQSGPLAGLGLGVKDIYDVAGYRTGCGNLDTYAQGSPATRSAPAVQVILDAGAHFLGKTQTDEFAFSLMGQNAHFPQPMNSAAPNRVTGGSSSGSAAAVAGGLADIALGSDTGGSIRAPASFCGLIGLRITHGRIPLDGVMPLAPSLDTVGWFARDMDVYEAVTEVMLAPSSHDERSDRARPRLLRLAALDELVFGPAEAAEYRRMLSIVTAALGDVETATPLSHSGDDLYWCFRKIQAREAWQSRGRWIETHPGSLDRSVEDRFRFGQTVDDAALAQAREYRAGFREELGALLGKDGYLVLPTVPGAAPLKSEAPDSLLAYRERALRLLCLSGLSGFPQISLPLGTVDGAPFGLSLLGPASSDRQLIALGRRILETKD